jgi:hypothetical protein
MAGVKGRSGGDRPDAPQSNFGVSAMGGAGSKEGQPKRYIPGMKSLGSTGTETMMQQGGAVMADNRAKRPVGALPKGGGQGAMGLNLKGLLDEDDNPLEPMSTGVDFGRGAGSDALPGYARPDTRSIENKEIVIKYLPAFANAAKSKNAPESFKRFTNYLMSKINVNV